MGRSSFNFDGETSSARAAEIVDIVSNGDQKELKEFCKDVTPGEGRIFADSMLIRTNYRNNANRHLL